MQPSNILHIKSLDNNWRDKDFVMLHACFQLLEDCIEGEKLLDGHINWEENTEHQEVAKKLKELYNWWQVRKLEEVNELLDDKIYQQDTDKLIELITLRQHLWT